MGSKTPKNTPHKNAGAALTPAKRMQQLPMPWAEANGDGSQAGADAESWPEYAREFLALVSDHSLAQWMARYLKEEVVGVQAPNTIEAKTRDLGAFAKWMADSEERADIRDWLPRDTQQYLRTLEAWGRAPTTINRAFATLRHFARWAQNQPGGIFHGHGSPMRGIKELVVDEPECKKLSMQEVHRLFRAADRLVSLADSAKRKSARPRRNRAILAILFYTGIRVSELVALSFDQWTGKHLVNVARKGRTRSKSIYLIAEARAAVDEYVATERAVDAQKGSDGWLFLSSQGGHLWRKSVQDALCLIAEEASKHSAAPIALHPHRLRHTFGAMFRERSGSDTETAAALGHTGLSHVKRYTRRSEEERHEFLEEVFT